MAMSHPTLVVVHTFLSDLEAQLAHSALEGAGIEATIRRDNCGGLEPPLTMVRGVDLLVREDQAEEARAILETPPVESAAE
jgi:hypothetical protein